MKQLLILFAVLAFLSACKKPEDRKCWKFTGDETTVEYPLEAFSRMKLHPHLAYEIIQDSLNKIEITGGKNLVNLIDFSVTNGLLEISNKNKCSFLRNAKKELVVRIHLTEISNIHYEGSEYLNSVGTIKSDYFVLSVRDGAGPVNLKMQSIIIDADISHGWGDYTLSGETKFARISARSNGFCDTYGLNVIDSIYVASDTPGTMKVKADGIPLRGFSKSSGDILYIGTPSVISVLCTGTGEVVNKN